MHACEYVRAWTCESLPGDACVCGSVCLGLCKAHAHCDCCEAMHACACLCVLMHEAHAHGDCCEASACVCLFVCSYALGVWSLWRLRGWHYFCGAAEPALKRHKSSKLMFWTLTCVDIPYLYIAIHIYCLFRQSSGMMHSGLKWNQTNCTCLPFLGVICQFWLYIHIHILYDMAFLGDDMTILISCPSQLYCLV